MLRCYIYIYIFKKSKRLTYSVLLLLLFTLDVIDALKRTGNCPYQLLALIFIVEEKGLFHLFIKKNPAYLVCILMQKWGKKKAWRLKYFSIADDFHR